MLQYLGTTPKILENINMLIIRNIFISSITFLFFIQLKYKMNGFYKDIIKDIRYFIRYTTVRDT